MRIRRVRRARAEGLARILTVVIVAILVAGCGTEAASPTPTPAPPSATASPTRGGTLRAVVPLDLWSNPLRDLPAEFLDPQLGWGSWRGNAWELWRCCLTRTLYSYNGQPTEKGGSTLQPDLAVDLPDVSSDGLTWTVHIRPGLHYGPPLEKVEITAPDFIRSFERLLAPVFKENAAYGDFTEIEGAVDYHLGKAASVSGLEAPDAQTLVFRLTRPEGDFGARLAEPFASPLPPNPYDPGAPFGIAQGANSGFGRFLVSSGPYMLLGSEKLDFTVPAATRKTAEGFAPGHIVLVRNPSWNAESDSLRPAYADRIEISLADSMDAAVEALDEGRADLVWPSGGTPPSVPPQTFEAFRSQPSRGQAHVDSMGVVRALIMNLAVPPFDSIDVRRALNYAIDKQALVRVEGGAAAAVPFGHIVGDSQYDNLLLGYDPYATSQSQGDPAKARAAMAKATLYDTNADGLCDVAACRHIKAVTRGGFEAVAAAAKADLAAVGIDLDVQVITDPMKFFAATADPAAKVPLTIGIGCGPSYLAATGCLSWFSPRYCPTEVCGFNLSAVGSTADELRTWGYRITTVPNIDDRFAACVPLIGAAQFQCYAQLDQYLMEQVVPWVPYSEERYATLTSPRVLAYGFDEWATTTALDQLALKQ